MAENLALLLATALPLMGGPGPATLSLAALGSAFGARRSLGYFCGIVLGTATVLGLVASGVAGLVLTLPGAMPVVSVLAAAYILYLAWRIATAPPLAAAAHRHQPPSLAAGYLLAVANPKAYAAIGAAYSGTTAAGADVSADAALRIATLLAVIVAVNGGWLMLGSAFAAALREPRLGRAVNIGFAVLLVASVALAVFERS